MVEFRFQGRIRIALVEGFRVVCILIIEIKNSIKILNDEKCTWYLTEDFNDYYAFIIYTDSEFIRKYLYSNCYYERLVEYNEEKK